MSYALHINFEKESIGDITRVKNAEYSWVGLMTGKTVVIRVFVDFRLHKYYQVLLDGNQIYEGDTGIQGAIAKNLQEIGFAASIGGIAITEKQTDDIFALESKLTSEFTKNMGGILATGSLPYSEEEFNSDF